MAGIPEGGFTNSEQLEAWLKAQPENLIALFSRVIAHRAALRALPLSWRIWESRNEDNLIAPRMTGAILRANAISRVALTYPDPGINGAAVAAATAAAYSARAIANYAGRAPTADNAAYAARAATADAAARAAYAATVNGADAAVFAASAAAAVAYAARTAAAGVAFWAYLTGDVWALKVGVAPAELADRPLWSREAPEWWEKEQRALDKALATAPSSDPIGYPETNWPIWSEWYRSRVFGTPSFGLPRDIADAIDRRIALGDGREDFWDRAPEAINAEIAGWVAEARGQLAYTPGLKATITVSAFILDFLTSRKEPSTIGEIRDAFVDANFRVVDKSMRGELSRLAKEGRIKRIAVGLYEAVRSATETIVELPDPEPQTSGAIQFSGPDNEPIGVRLGRPGKEWSTDEAASARHDEVRRLADRVNTIIRERHSGNNSIADFRDEFALFSDSLGDTVEKIDINRLFQRGDAIRDTISAHRAKDDFSKLDPVPDDVLLAADKAIKAYNAFVSLDGELARRDEALLGPDAKRALIGPKEGQREVAKAVAAGVAKAEVEQVLGEEAKVAPAVPDAESRKSRRYSEGNKNLNREVVARAIKWVAGGASATGGALYAAAQFLWNNKEWFLEAFAGSPKMLEILHKILEILAKLPLL